MSGSEVNNKSIE